MTTKTARHIAKSALHKENWQSLFEIKVDKIASGLSCLRHFERAQKFIRNGFSAKNCVIAYT